MPVQNEPKNIVEDLYMDNFYCPALKNGLVLRFRDDQTVVAQHCCLQSEYQEFTGLHDVWHDPKFQQSQQQKFWPKSCANCRSLEESGLTSQRTSLIKKYGRRDLGRLPIKLDLSYDNNCNLACRTCSPELSSLWVVQTNTVIPIQKNKIDYGLWVKSYLDQLDLSRVQEITFSGGETLLGSSYYKLTEYISGRLDPEYCMISFQTNGTQPWLERYLPALEKFKLIKLNISVDGILNRFEYLRWPARWDEWQSNVQNLINQAPHNVMFNFEETISIFNLYYLNESSEYFSKNFLTNRLGDPVNLNRHLAGGIFSLSALSQSYVNALPVTVRSLVARDFQPSPGRIRQAILEINKIDQIRQQSFKNVFPEIYDFYQQEF